MDPPIYRSAERRLNESKEGYQDTEPWKKLIKLQEDFDLNRPGLFEKCVSMNENSIDDFAVDFATE